MQCIYFKTIYRGSHLIKLYLIYVLWNACIYKRLNISKNIDIEINRLILNYFCCWCFRVFFHVYSKGKFSINYGSVCLDLWKRSKMTTDKVRIDQ